jgi:predicted cupin superfamily sugar epimerase
MRTRRHVLERLALAAVALLVTPLASRRTVAAAINEQGAPVAADLTADEIIKLLKLEANATCGFVRDTYKSTLEIAAGGLPAPFADRRPLGTALYFLMTPRAPVKLHRIKNDQLYHYYLGDPIELLMLHTDGTHSFATVGPDLRSGQTVQQFIPGDTFHTARVGGRRRWFLGGSTEWPGVVVDEDVELGNADALAAKYPAVAAEIRSFPTPAA